MTMPTGGQRVSDERLAQICGWYGAEHVEAGHVALDLRDARAERDRLRAALAEIQWGAAPQSDDSDCPWCLGTRANGHNPTCGIRAALSGASSPAAAPDALRDAVDADWQAAFDALVAKVHETEKPQEMRHWMPDLGVVVTVRAEHAFVEGSPIPTEAKPEGGSGG